MAIFNDLQPTETVEDSDEILLHQNDIDKRVNFEVATAINWATLQGYTYEGVHELGTVYTTLNSFATSSGIAYFPKYNTTVPYTSTSSNPATDSNLARLSYKDYISNIEAVRTEWATLEDYTYEGLHSSGTVYTTLNSFAISSTSGIAYFPRYDTAVPYTSTVAEPANDTKLTLQSYKDYKNSVDNTYTVGTTLQRFDATNPNTLYPWQTWLLIQGDVSIRLGDGTAQSTTAQGTNTPAVPLLAHTHSMNHDHPSTTTSSVGDHSHNTFNRIDQTEEQGEDGWHLQTSGGENEPYSQQGYTDAAGAHDHNVDIPNYVGNTGSTGESSAYLDVRGAFIKMNLWLRTA